MSYKKQKDELKSLLLSGYPLIYIVAEDERPVISVLKKVLVEIERDYQFYSWDLNRKAFDENSGENYLKKEGDKLVKYNSTDLLIELSSKNENIITVLHDFNFALLEKSNEPNYQVRRLKQIFLDVAFPFTKDFSLKKFENSHDPYFKHIVMTSPNRIEIPKEIEKLTKVIEFGLPGKEEVVEILTSFMEENKLTFDDEEKKKVVSGSLGLTETQIFYAYKKSLIEKGTIIPKDIYNLKKELIKGSGALEFINTEVKIEDMGGFDNAVEWMKKRKLALDENVRKKYNLDIPKGVLLTGIQGCGKSFFAKGLSNYLDLPLVRLNYGGLMGRYVGESEENLRKAISSIEAISPCVLWIDEIEKSVPNDKTNGTESMMRVFGHLITWMQEKQSLVFVVATANNIEYLPPELMRKGRFDELFFVDLPTKNERKNIISIHLNKRKLKVESFDLDLLSKETKGFSGAEIEQLVVESLLEAAYLKDEVTTELIVREVKKTNPLSVTMKDKVQAIREWAKKHNVRRVSSDLENKKAEIENNNENGLIGFLKSKIN